MQMTSVDADLICKADLLIWDESTMAPGIALKACDRLLKELMQNQEPYGGKTLMLGGDFRQQLSVVPHGSQSAIVEASIKFNEYWQKFNVIKLKNNVRTVDTDFSNWLIQLGDGKLSNTHGLPDDIIEIPTSLICTHSIIKEIFGERLSPHDVARFSKTAILCPKNYDVDNINEEVLELLEGAHVTYFSSDSIHDESDDDKQNYPVEFLNELTPSGMPIHKLNLKKGSIVMLLRNLNTKRGLCNGIRLVVKELKSNLIIARKCTRANGLYTEN